MDDAATEANTSRPGSPNTPLPDLPSPTRQPTYRFNWDPALRRAGPGSVSEATDNRADPYPSQRPDLSLLNNASALTLALPHDWSSSKHGFNAISTVLNNPHKRAAPPKAHSALPPVAPAELPRVKRRDFEPYLAAVAPHWERFARNARLGAAQPDAPADPPRSPPPLATVPAVFFSAAFDLGAPDTFARVTETGDPAALAHALPLRSKLAHYADVVEQHLVRELARRSAAFFAALAALQELQAEAAAGRARVARLRAALREVDARTARRGLELVRLEGRRANVERVAEGVRVVRDVGEMVAVAGGLVQAGQWGEALGVIDELETLWGGAPKDADAEALGGRAAPDAAQPPIPLSSLQAFSSLPAHLRELTLEIATSLTSDLVSVLKSDLHTRAEAAQGDEKAGEALRDRLKPLLQGLVRTQAVKGALVSWREVVMVEVREAVKRHLPSSDIDDDDLGSKKTLTERSASLAKDLRGMSHDEFLQLARAIYASLLRCLQGVQAQNQIIAALLEPISASTTSSVEADLSDTLASACELANTRASKVIYVRAEQHAQLALAAFHALFEATWEFVVGCEVLCRRMIVGLRGAVVSQAKAFLVAFHGARIAESAKLVEDEQWAQVDVAPEMQRVVELVVDAAMRDPAGLVLPRAEALLGADGSSGGVQQPLSPPSTPRQGSPAAALPVADKAAARAKQLRIEDRRYFVVSATLEVLVVLLADYVKLIVNLPLLTTDAVGRVIEFLKAFNSRTCQVVLGAGAMRSAGLKNITAKHLALASQSLSIGIGLIPYVRETFRRHLSATQAVMLVEFDKLKRDYQEHQHEIEDKLVVIMGDRLGVHCRALQDVKWELPAATAPNGYMELLVKETVTLHKVLTKYLAPPTVELVMTQVLAAINHRLSEEYGTIHLAGEEARQRLLQDARYLHDKTSALKHVGAPGRMLETVVLEKPVPRAAPAPAPAKQSRLSSRMAAVVAGAAKEPGAKAVPARQPEGGETPTPPPSDGIRDQDPGACLDRHAER